MTTSEALTPEQYETVLKYMETTNMEDFDSATETLKLYNFNLHVSPSQCRMQSVIDSEGLPQTKKWEILSHFNLGLILTKSCGNTFTF